jgi:hypothetical protein
MKYIIKENQIDKLSSFFQSKIDEMEIEGLCYAKISKTADKKMISFVVDLYLDENYKVMLYDMGRPIRIHFDYIAYRIKNQLKSYGDFKFNFYEYEIDCSKFNEN